jgi:DNA polymerase-4
MDVEHAEHGPGWVWGAGADRVTVRFETRHTGPGRVLTFRADDPALAPRRHGVAGSGDGPGVMGGDASARPRG